MIKRRLGPEPHLYGDTPNLDGCPDMFELDNGDFAIIGKRSTEELKPHLPEDAGCGSDEEIIVIPRSTLLNAKKDIPSE